MAKVGDNKFVFLVISKFPHNNIPLLNHLFLLRVWPSCEDVRKRKAGRDVFRWHQTALSHSWKTSEKGLLKSSQV